MRRYFGLAILLTIWSCSTGSDDEAACFHSRDCPRGEVCTSTGCVGVPCGGHGDCAVPYLDTICWKGYDGMNPEAGICSAIECKEGSAILVCSKGFECSGFICFEAEPQCLTSAECKQPAEKCYDNQCVLANYCELAVDCPSGECTLETHSCVPPEETDIIEDNSIPVEDIVDCDPEDFEDPVSYLCTPCNNDLNCGCGLGKCADLGEGKACTMSCDQEGAFCPSGYQCQDDVCKPLGGKCKGCILPPGCEGKDQVCNFKQGTCQQKMVWCGMCTFDFECGFGNRCHMDEKSGNPICVPECDSKTFSCPLASGCEIRDDGLMVCLYNNPECCYGVNCEQECFCELPYPYCDENNDCVQCLVNGHCPPGKPICEPESKACIIQCVPPTPTYWVDPDSGLEYCLECLTSKDCAPGMFCGTFENDPMTYHKCYYPQ